MERPAPSMQPPRYACGMCGITFTRRHSRDVHVSRKHGTTIRHYECAICGNVFQSVSNLRAHRDTHQFNSEYVRIDTHFNQSCITYEKIYEHGVASIQTSLSADIDAISNLLSFEAKMKKYIKYSIITYCEFIKLDGDEVENANIIIMRAPTASLIQNGSPLKDIKRGERIIIQRVEDFINNGSNYILNAVIKTRVEVAKCRSLNGSCGRLSVTTLRSAKKVGAKANLNGDNNCFFYCIASYFTGSSDINVLKRFMIKHIDTQCVKVPVDVGNIDRFERVNGKLDLRINVLYEEDGSVYPIYASRNTNHKNIVCILLYKTMVGNRLTSHYALISNLDKLLRKDYVSKKNGKSKPQGDNATTTSYGNSFVCMNCLNKFSLQSSLDSHTKLCNTNKPQRLTMPPEDGELEFDKHFRKFRMPIIGFFDFECCMKKPDSSCLHCDGGDKCFHKTEVDKVQEPVTYALVFVNWNNEIVHKNVYSGENCAEHLIDELLELEAGIVQTITQNRPMELTQRDEYIYKMASICHICELPLTPNGTNRTVRDHCHITGMHI